jgi:hypothetical protein
MKSREGVGSPGPAPASFVAGARRDETPKTSKRSESRPQADSKPRATPGIYGYPLATPGTARTTPTAQARRASGVCGVVPEGPSLTASWLNGVRWSRNWRRASPRERPRACWIPDGSVAPNVCGVATAMDTGATPGEEGPPAPAGEAGAGSRGTGTAGPRGQQGERTRMVASGRPRRIPGRTCAGQPPPTRWPRTPAKLHCIR